MKEDKKILYLIAIILLCIGLITFSVSTGISSLSADATWGSGSSWGNVSELFDFKSLTDDPTNIGLIKYIAIGIGALILFIIVMAILFGGKRTSRKQIYKKLTNNPQAIEHILREIPNFDIEAFKKFAINNFIGISEAWTNFDYDKLKNSLTPVLYETYKNQLKSFEYKKQRNVLNGFKKIDCAINRFEKNEKEYDIQVSLKIKHRDYIEDNKGFVLKGNKLNKYVITYNLTYTKSILGDNHICPNCKSPLDNAQSNICPVCGKVVITSAHGWILSKKQIVDQYEV